MSARSLAGERDTLTLRGARALGDRIQEYWAARRVAITPEIRHIEGTDCYAVVMPFLPAEPARAGGGSGARRVVRNAYWPRGSNARLLARQIRCASGFTLAEATTDGPKVLAMPPLPVRPRDLAPRDLALRDLALPADRAAMALLARAADRCFAWLEAFARPGGPSRPG